MSVRLGIFILAIGFVVSDALAGGIDDTGDFPEARIQTVSYFQEPYDVQAKRLLKNGDFNAALDAYRKSLRTNETDASLRRQYEELRRIIRLRHELPDSHNARKTVVYEQLRRYYLRHEIHRENIALTAGNFCENKTRRNAFLLIEALVAAGHFQESLDFIDSLDPEQIDEQYQINRAEILINAGRLKESVAILKSFPIDEISSPETLLRISRLQAATKQNASAVKTLARCFDLMPLIQLRKVKQEVIDYPEFQSIRSAWEFQATLLIRDQEAPCGKSCARKWIGVSFYEESEYLSRPRIGEIDMRFWRVH